MTLFSVFRIGLVIVCCCFFQFSHGQDRKYLKDFFGSDTSEIIGYLTNYIQNRQLRGQLYRTDSTVAIDYRSIVDSSKWTDYVIFTFNKEGKCYVIQDETCNFLTRCKTRFQRLVDNGEYGFRKITEKSYLSNYYHSEILTYEIDGECFILKRTKLFVSRKKFRAIRQNLKKQFGS